jgi:proteasome lid subunit RPN8/RPN11
VIQLTAHHCNEIASHGESDYPNECCGMLIGRFGENGTKIVTETRPISNTRHEEARRNRFLIQPEELLLAEKYAAKQKLDVVGFYHSHPDHPAAPSQYDLEHAWPLYSYIIISVRGGRTEDLRSWEIEPSRSRFNEEEVLKGS